MCGEHTDDDYNGTYSTGSSPHVRGAPRGSGRFGRAGGIIPACAGSTPSPNYPCCSGRDHPRMCGEHAIIKRSTNSDAGSSPHVRGARGRFSRSIPHDGIIPACAGSTMVAGRHSTPSRDHPRMCGEHAVKVWRLHLFLGSSPHVRGAHVDRIGLLGHLGIIPACAGSTVGLFVCCLFVWDHPRMCGEHRALC